jgi:hypothetical protein
MSKESWWKSKGDERELLTKITQDINQLETTQLDGYERFYRLAFLYDPYDYLGRIYYPAEYNIMVTENICAAGVDTVTSMIAKVKHRAVFMTDGADFTAKRQAADRGRYAEGMSKSVRLDERRPRIFKDAAIFGTGLLRFEIDANGVITHERFLPVEVRVNEQECISQAPRSMHLLKYRDREELQVKYPDKNDQLEEHGKDVGSFWFGVGPADQTDQLLVRESYRLPVGTKGKPGYRPGRKVVSTDKLVLLDEPYELPRLPIAVLRWNERTTGFMGKGLIEDLMGHQRTINKQNAAMDTQIDMHAAPVNYVQENDLGVVTKMAFVPGVGRFVPYRVAKPEISIPKIIAEEVLQRQVYLKQSYLEVSGISAMHAHGEMPLPRAETGAAVQEMNDVTSERFSIQEQASERWYLDCIEVMFMLIGQNARLGTKEKPLETPEVPFSFAHIAKRIKWAKVDDKDIVFQIQAAPQFSRTLSGRYQQIADWANQGVISADEARHLINHPDLDSAMSLFDAYREHIDRVKQLLLDGEYVAPDPRENLALGLSWMVMGYFEAMNDGAPEDRVENIRTWTDQAAFLLSKQQQPAPPMGAPGPGGAPPAAAAPPMAA